MYKNTKNNISNIIRVANELLEKYPDLEKEADVLIESAHKIGGSTLSGNFPDQDVMSSLVALLDDQHIKFAIMGGVAVSIHGIVRATDDIDIAVYKLPDTSDVEYMRKFNFYKAKSQTGTVLTIDHRKTGFVEMLLANSDLMVYAIDSAKPHNVLHASVNVVEPDALIGLKVRAVVENPKREHQDIVDIVAVYNKNKPNLSNVMTLLNEAEINKLKDILSM